MKKLIMLLCFATMVLFGVSSEVLDSKYFKYDLAGEQILNTTGLKGDYVYISDFSKDFKDYSGTITEFEIPQEIEGLPVIGMTMGALANPYQKNTKNLTKIIVPESIRYLDYGYFDLEYLPNLQEIEYRGNKPLYAETIEIVGKMPQKDKPLYTSFITINNIESSTITIDSDLHFFSHIISYGDINDMGIRIYNKKESIKEIIFDIPEIPKIYSDVEKVTFTSKVKTLSALCFSNCNKLKEVIFPENAKFTYLKTVNGEISAFERCTNLGLKTKTAIKASGYTGSFN